uniref:Annexin n=1 Tax=Daphnia galeata TaxID=27404 RepID=A0A8J2WIQ6_9CRUS|nr:unnamed protein product [Daphnia galeata]
MEQVSIKITLNISTLKPNSFKNIPTVYPASSFNPQADADVLHTAMQGLGTDENALINILCHRTCEAVTSALQSVICLQGNLWEESCLKSEFSGSFEKIKLCLPLAEFMAREVYESIMYGNPIEQEIKGDTSGDFELLLVSLIKGTRNENKAVNVDEASADSHLLFKAGAAKIGTDESVFNSIFASRSWPHLRQVIIEYHEMHGHTLEHAVMSEFSANAEIVSRCDIDLQNIKQEYEKKFNRSLQDDVSSDTSGDYRKALLALIC